MPVHAFLWSSAHRQAGARKKSGLLVTEGMPDLKDKN